MLRLCIRQINVGVTITPTFKSPLQLINQIFRMFILTRDIKNRQDALNEFFGFFNHEFDALALGCTLKTTDLPDFLGPLAGGGWSRDISERLFPLFCIAACLQDGCKC